MIKKYLSLTVFGLATLAPAAFATTVLNPGTGTQTPDTLTMGSATLLNSTSGTLTAPTISGNFTESVYADQSNVFCAGCLDFVITLDDTSGTIERISSSSFAGFNVDAGYASGLGSTPSNLQRSDDGSVVAFGFGGSGANLTSGDTTNQLIVETDATSFTSGYLSIQDGTSTSAVAFAPTAAPEPMSMSLLGGGLMGLGLLRLRRRSAKK